MGEHQGCNRAWAWSTRAPFNLPAHPPTRSRPSRTAHSLTVVMAATGYPGTPVKGGMIADIAKAEAHGAKVFHAGTVRDETRVLRASGGRVLNVSARGATVRAARDAAYQAVDAIDFAQGFCRPDIGWREIAREG